MDRHGISPLVATVLLIAFAVSLGAVVMNWTSATGVSVNSGEICREVSLRILDKDGGKDICFERSSNLIIFNIENGAKKIDGVRLSTLGSTSDTSDIQIEISPGIIQNFKVPYDPIRLGELSKAKIIPFIGEKEKAFCTNTGEFIHAIKDC
jgi:flagellin-like protein